MNDRMQGCLECEEIGFVCDNGRRGCSWEKCTSNRKPCPACNGGAYITCFKCQASALKSEAQSTNPADKDQKWFCNKCVHEALEALVQAVKEKSE